MPMTLLEASKRHSGDVVRAGLIEVFARSNPLVEALRWLDIPGGSYHYSQEAKLSGVAFRGINDTYNESTSIVVPQTEVLRILGGEIDVDTALIKMHGDDIREQEEVAKTKALGLYVAKKIIKGDSLTNPLEWDGLQNRLTGSQVIDAGVAVTNGGDALSLAKLDEAIDAVDTPTHIIASKDMVRLLTQASRATGVSGFITYSQDEMGRRVTHYNDLPFLIMDYDENGAKILDFNELAGTGATATAQSMYVVNLADGYIQGLQNGTPEVEDLGKVQDKPVYRTRFEYLAGLATLHPRCASRLRGIKKVAVVA